MRRVGVASSDVKVTPDTYNLRGVTCVQLAWLRYSNSQWLVPSSDPAWPELPAACR